MLRISVSARLFSSAVVLAAALTILSAPGSGLAQQADRRPLVGVLSQLSPEGTAPITDPFVQRLTELGYIEGENVFFEYRFADGDQSKLPALAEELVQLQPDVIYSPGTAPTQAATAATASIPIVVSGAGDPVAAGWANSAERPGGNVTGVQAAPSALVLAQFEFALELVPGATKVGALLDETFVRVEQDREDFAAAADALGVQLVMVEYDPADGPDAAFEQLQDEGAEVLVIRSTGAQRAVQARLAELVIQLRLPAVGHELHVEAGGLASIGNSPSARPTLAAEFVDQILKGASPAELPLAPDQRTLAINLEAARTLDLEISPELRSRADRLID